jgi:hypothetical protein
MTANLQVVGDGIDSASEVGGAEAGSAVSAQKLRANRENALRSTGPRSVEGKRNSANNALKHGGFAAAAVAIPRGRFAEDPDALRDFIEGIVVSLDPRDALEREQARRIAIAYVRARRLSIYEAESVGRPEHTGIDDDLGDGSGLERELAQARRFRS